MLPARPLRAAGLALAALACLTSCGPSDDRPTAPTERATRRVDGQVHMLQLNRVQGMVDGIPCVEAPVPVLAAATDLRDSLRDGGDQAYLVCVGDTLTAAKSASARKVDGLVAEAARSVVVEALGRAQIDLYVPGALDLSYGASDMLDLAAEAGLRVLVTNGTDLSGRDRIVRSWLPEPSDPDGPRLAFLGAVPVRATDEEGKTNFLSDDALELTSVIEAVEAEAKRLRAEEDVDFVVVVSALAQPTNSRMTDTESVDVILGAREGGTSVRQLAFRSGTALATSAALGAEVGHTLISIVDDDFGLADVSERHELAERIERERKWVAPFAQTYGTSDLVELERRVREARSVDGVAIADRIKRLAEDSAGLVEMNEYSRSRIDHFVATLPDVSADHPVRSPAGEFGARFARAVEAADMRPPTRTLEHPRVPHPDDCFECHKDQYLFWAQTPHATAFDSLVESERQYDSSCHECHSTGFRVDGGYDDPRLEDPLGGVSCFACHKSVSSLHAINARRSLEPLYDWSIQLEQKCGSCHNERRSPGFDQTLVMDQVACPPMDLLAPELVQTRLDALEIIEGRFVDGRANDVDRLFAARARVAAGVDEAVEDLVTLAEEYREDGVVTVQIARMLDRYGYSKEAQGVARAYLADYSGDIGMNTAYAHLLLFPTDESATDADGARTRLQFLLPDSTITGETEARNVLLRCYLVDALYMTGRVSEGEEELLDLIARQGEDSRIRERVLRWDLSPRLLELARAAREENLERAELGLSVQTTEEPLDGIDR